MLDWTDLIVNGHRNNSTIVIISFFFTLFTFYVRFFLCCEISAHFPEHILTGAVGVYGFI